MGTLGRLLGATVLIAALAAAVAYPWWRELVWPSASADDPHPHGDNAERVKVSPQARANLKVVVKTLEPVETFWRTMTVPGWVVEKEGSCERVLAAPMAGIVRRLWAVRGDLLQPGKPLVTLQIVSEQIHSAQAALHKTLREAEFYKEEKKRLTAPVESGAIPAARMLEVDKQLKLLTGQEDGLKQELKSRGLSAADIAKAAAGQFVTEITLPVPEFAGAVAHKENETHDIDHHLYELEELKVMLGASVNAGDPLFILADHHDLQIEGRVFPSEALLIQQAAQRGTPVKVSFSGEDDKMWPAFKEEPKITNLSNRVDSQHQTLSFYLPLPNQYQEYERRGKTYRLWRFRPGQRVQLRFPAEAFHDVFVAPASAVVREGAETFVFRENGDFFERRPVHVLFEDKDHAVIARDGSVHAGTPIAISAAVQINWAMKAQQQGGGGHHHHHDH